MLQLCVAKKIVNAKVDDYSTSMHNYSLPDVFVNFVEFVRHITDDKIWTAIMDVWTVHGNVRVPNNLNNLYVVQMIRYDHRTVVISKLFQSETKLTVLGISIVF